MGINWPFRVWIGCVNGGRELGSRPRQIVQLCHVFMFNAKTKQNKSITKQKNEWNKTYAFFCCFVFVLTFSFFEWKKKVKKKKRKWIEKVWQSSDCSLAAHKAYKTVTNSNKHAGINRANKPGAVRSVTPPSVASSTLEQWKQFSNGTGEGVLLVWFPHVGDQ